MSRRLRRTAIDAYNLNLRHRTTGAIRAYRTQEEYEKRFFSSAEVNAISITAPNGSENWHAGSTQTITWTSTGTVGDVKIELYKGGTQNSTLSAIESNDGSYNWAIPSSVTNASDYRIRITSTDDDEVFDESDSNFSVTSLAYTTGMLARWKAEVNSLTLDGTTVTQWNDLSGNAKHLIRYDTSNGPVWDDDGWPEDSDRGVIDFSDTSCEPMYLSSTFSLTDPPFFIVTISQRGDSSFGEQAIFSGRLSTRTTIFTDSGGQTWRISNTTTRDTHIASTADCNSMSVFFSDEDSESQLYVHNVLAADDIDCGEAQANRWMVGGVDHATSRKLWRGSIAEVIIFDHLPDAAARAQIEAYVADYWACE